MANCEFKISAGIGVSNCANMPFQGLKQRAFIFNKDDIQTYSTEGAKPVVNDLSLVSGARGYEVINVGRQPYNGTATELAVQDTGVNNFTKTAVILIQENTTQNALTVDALANGKFVLVIQNEWVDAERENAFEVIGLQRGLSASAITENKYEGGGTQVTLTEEGASNFKLFLKMGEGDPVTETTTFLESLCSTGAKP